VASTTSSPTTDDELVDLQDPAVLERRLEAHRRELTGYCYRMLGSGFEAEDAVQETLVRAWKAIGRFEGRSSLRSWLYRIATNVCLDHLNGRQRRARPMEMGPSSLASATLDAGLPEHAWVQPVSDTSVLPDGGDPAEVAAARESIRLAFITALQILPPRQRAVLILCEVLRWKADEVAELLDTSTASVNSALQRARATLGDAQLDRLHQPPAPDPELEELLARYVEAFEAYDMDALVDILHAEVVQSMPPFALWLEGREQTLAWLTGTGKDCEGSRLLPVQVNGTPCFAQYRPDPAGGHAPWAIQVLEVGEGQVTGFHAYVYPELFPAFGLPTHLPAHEDAGTD
jgi:RNA polymerase sigma-70 factor, ECF subfamily